MSAQRREGAGPIRISESFGVPVVDDLLTDHRKTLGPLMPRLGLAVYLAARLEFALRFIHYLATNRPIDHAMPQGKLVREAKESIRRGESSLEIAIVVSWLEATSQALETRGRLAHALWSVASDVLPEDMARMGLTDDEIANHVPGSVHRSELRAERTVATTPDDLDHLCYEMHDLLESAGRVAKMTRSAVAEIDA